LGDSLSSISAVGSSQKSVSAEFSAIWAQNNKVMGQLVTRVQALDEFLAGIDKGMKNNEEKILRVEKKQVSHQRIERIEEDLQCLADVLKSFEDIEKNVKVLQNDVKQF